MDRRAFIVGGVAALGAPLTGEVQEEGKVRRVGLLVDGDPALMGLQLNNGLRRGLRELGYVEGVNLVIDVQYETLPGLVEQLVHWRPDVVVTNTVRGTRAAVEAAPTTPVVMAAVDDPLGAGLIQSLGRPGGNVTGMTLLNVDLSRKRLQLLTEVLPNASRVAVIWNALTPQSEAAYKETESAAVTLHMTIVRVPVRGPEETARAIAAALNQAVQAMIVIPDPLTFSNRVIREAAAASRVPTMWTFAKEVVDGGLMAYGPDLLDVYRKAAIYIDRIFKGAKPSDLPVEQPTKTEFVINLKTAKALGLTIPPSLLAQADQVIE
jgi:putative tryptophan/tyrosine transport system substrate-binding protein